MRGTASRLGLAMQRHGPAAMLAICGALAFQFPLSNLWNPQTYAIDGQVRAADAAMARVPDGVTVETDLGLLAPLAARTDTFWLGTPGNPPPQYIVFDSGSTDFQPPPANVPEFISHRHPGVTYREIFRDDGVYVFRRISGDDRLRHGRPADARAAGWRGNDRLPQARPDNPGRGAKIAGRPGRRTLAPAPCPRCRLARRCTGRSLWPCASSSDWP
jgi:hypothetical protein